MTDEHEIQAWFDALPVKQRRIVRGDRHGMQSGYPYRDRLFCQLSQRMLSHVIREYAKYRRRRDGLPLPRKRPTPVPNLRIDRMMGLAERKKGGLVL
jgi:hypothetical protein